MKEKQAIKALCQEAILQYRDDRGFWVDLDAMRPIVYEGEDGLTLIDEVFVVAAEGLYHLMVGQYKQEAIEISRVPFKNLDAFMLVLYAFFSARMNYEATKFPF